MLKAPRPVVAAILAAASPAAGAALLLGLLQGLTEFLPVSSSGHLAAVQLLWPRLAHPGVTLEIALHLGTTAAVLLYYRKTVAALFGAGDGSGDDLEDLGAGRWWICLGAGTLPTVMVGFAGRSMIRSAFDNLSWVVVGLVISGLFLAATRWRPGGDRRLGPLSAVAVGLIQGFAILPGVSRSGATISAALVMGIPRRQAVVFSFLLSVPAILGASALDAAAQMTEPGWTGGLFVNVGFATLLAAGVGYLCIGLVHRATREAWWHHFAWYCWALALVLAMTGR